MIQNDADVFFYLFKVQIYVILFLTFDLNNINLHPLKVNKEDDSSYKSDKNNIINNNFSTKYAEFSGK
jgi:hypothetical protein